MYMVGMYTCHIRAAASGSNRVYLHEANLPTAKKVSFALT